MNTIHKSDYDYSEDRPSLSEIVNMLDEMKNEHFPLLDSLIPANRQPTDPIGHFLVAVLRRSLALIEGFKCMAEKRNRTCAVPLIRLQLDNAMRVFATCSMVSDRDAFVGYMLNGGKGGKFKSTDGKELSDRLLHEESSKKYPGFSEAYKRSCGFIHLSREHLFQVLDFGGLMRGETVFADCRRLPEWPAQVYNNDMQGFVAATGIFLEESRELASLRRKTTEKDNPVSVTPAPQVNQD